MSGLFKRLFSRRTTEDQKNDKGEIIHPKGTLEVRGAKCPKCGQFHAYAFRVWACNYCGFRVKANTVPTAWQERRHTKYQQRQEKWKQEKLIKEKALAHPV